MWTVLAYCAKYGNQPLSELRALPSDELFAFRDALVKIVRLENKKGKKSS